MTGSYSKTVLVVDDDTIFHFLMKKALPRLGVLPDSIQCALNGKEALSLIEQYKESDIPLPDVIFLDINMPIMGGFGFLEELNRLDVNQEVIKVIMISSSLDSRDADRAYTLGATKVLTKPVSDKDLELILKLN